MKKTQQKQEENTLRIAQYKSTFLKPTGFVARTGKSAYISPDFHEKLSRIVFMLGGGKITLADYLHSVLKHHLEDFGEEIKTIYASKQNPIL
ncbi:hypothetical protein BAY13_17225 [Elizabethkingia bruuniana]|uniref:DUF3408 domain-containing protein n=1 Tax=Elizabethkingia bruuniana TaxID=1756149 RepID=UPI00099A0BE8|nr:DUF3408 domain-containing protein [Elizabethkingia bruuniana]OPC66474.1 hypothetical protein BAY13_17225 [Elizabethkingia bruuniana]